MTRLVHERRLEVPRGANGIAEIVSTNVTSAQPRSDTRRWVDRAFCFGFQCRGEGQVRASARQESRAAIQRWTKVGHCLERALISCERLVRRVEVRFEHLREPQRHVRPPLTFGRARELRLQHRDQLLVLAQRKKQTLEVVRRRRVVGIRGARPPIVPERFGVPPELLLGEASHAVQQGSSLGGLLGQRQLLLVHAEQVFPTPGSVVDSAQARERWCVALFDGEHRSVVRERCLVVQQELFADLTRPVQERHPTARFGDEARLVLQRLHQSLPLTAALGCALQRVQRAEVTLVQLENAPIREDRVLGCVERVLEQAPNLEQVHETRLVVRGQLDRTLVELDEIRVTLRLVEQAGQGAERRVVARHQAESARVMGHGLFAISELPLLNFGHAGVSRRATQVVARVRRFAEVHVDQLLKGRSAHVEFGQSLQRRNVRRSQRQHALVPADSARLVRELLLVDARALHHAVDGARAIRRALDAPLEHSGQRGVIFEPLVNARQLLQHHGIVRRLVEGAFERRSCAAQIHQSSAEHARQPVEGGCAHPGIGGLAHARLQRGREIAEASVRLVEPLEITKRRRRPRFGVEGALKQLRREHRIGRLRLDEARSLGDARGADPHVSFACLRLSLERFVQVRPRARGALHARHGRENRRVQGRQLERCFVRDARVDRLLQPVFEHATLFVKQRSLVFRALREPHRAVEHGKHLFEATLTQEHSAEPRHRGRVVRTRAQRGLVALGRLFELSEGDLEHAGALVVKAALADGVALLGQVALAELEQISRRRFSLHRSARHHGVALGVDFVGMHRKRMPRGRLDGERRGFDERGARLGHLERRRQSRRTRQRRGKRRSRAVRAMRGRRLVTAHRRRRRSRHAPRR